MMKEYDMDRDFWLIAYFRCRQIDRDCVVSYAFPSIHIYFIWKKKMTARAEAFQPGHLTWRALASRRHWWRQKRKLETNRRDSDKKGDKRPNHESHSQNTNTSWCSDKYFIANVLLNPNVKNFENRKTFGKVMNGKYRCFLTHGVLYAL